MARKRSRSYSSSSSSEHDTDGSHRKRSRKSRGKERERDDKREKQRHKPSREDEINVDDDFYSKSKEFRHWLKHGRSKPKQFAKLDMKEQRRYFKKFARRWNKGKLDKGYYDGSILGEAGDSSIREATQDRVGQAGSSSGNVIQGPTRPTLDDLSMQQELDIDSRAAQRDLSRAEQKRERREAKDEERDNRATGRDRVMEKRAEARQGAREMAAAKEHGDMEFGDDVLMGSSSSSFAEAIRRRDSSRANQQKQKKQMAKQAELSDKRTDYQKKEDSTMAMFKAMAAARYGTSS